MSRERWIQEFGEFLSLRGIQHFSPVECCNVGAVHNGVTLRAPLREMWSNIVPTLLVAEWLRAELRLHYPKAVILPTSGYRDPAYNLAWKGEPNSLHTRFNALDIEAYSEGSEIPAKEVQAIARSLSVAGGMGIGSYPGFTHIDTRGTLGMKTARW